MPTTIDAIAREHVESGGVRRLRYRLAGSALRDAKNVG
jgi:hypothetical protein